jgi:phage anti-repressor protein
MSGFGRKDFAKKLLLKHFIKEKDYKILLPEHEPFRQLAEKKLNKPGKPKEQILMTIKTFKKFCMKANTDKADEIHDYYIKLEELLHETLQEESEELRNGFHWQFDKSNTHLIM